MTQGTRKLRRKAIVARERLEADYECLLDYSERFSERCTGGISIMMNDAMFRRSQRAIEQHRGYDETCSACFSFRATVFYYFGLFHAFH